MPNRKRLRCLRGGFVLAALALSIGPVTAATAAAPGPAAPPAAAIAPAPAETHLQRATRLILEEHLDGACGELSLAYAESHDPLLLLRIGRLRLRLGQKDEAKEAYSRFLTEAQAPHPGLKAEAEEALRTLTPPPPPPPLPPDLLPPPPQILDVPGAKPLYIVGPPIAARPVVRHRNRRIIKIGSVLFSAGYLPALVIPLALSTSLDQPNAPSVASNYTVMIPLLGPFVSGIVAPATNPNGHAAQLLSSWSMPWMLTSGVLQVTGFALMVAGALPRWTN